MDALGALARVEPRHVPPPERTARWAPRHESSDGILSEAEQRRSPTSLRALLGADLVYLLLLEVGSIVVLCATLERMPSVFGAAASSAAASEGDAGLNASDAAEEVRAGAHPHQPAIVYATVAGGVSIGMGLGLLTLRLRRRGDALRRELALTPPLRRALGRVTVLEAGAFLLVLWWLPATGVLTFRQPFDQIGNGYFALWGCLLASLALLSSASRKYRVRTHPLLHHAALHPRRLRPPSTQHRTSAAPTRLSPFCLYPEGP